MIDLSKPVEVANNIWWVGSKDSESNYHCNPYLLIEGDTGVLFDPGSALDGELVLKKVLSLLPIEKLEAIVCSHQDPDLCMAIPIFENAGFNGWICCHERTYFIHKYYGFKSPYYLVNHHDYAYTMKGGFTFNFIFTPYLHYSGSIMSYIAEQQVLITGDVFGAVTADWQLYSDETYFDGMVAYHEQIMPSHEVLAAAMVILARYPIKMICPQHGSIIKHDIPRHIEILKDLPCGLFLESKKHTISEDGEITGQLEVILTRLISIHGIEQVKQIYKNSGITIDAKKRHIVKSNYPEHTLWQTFFSIIEEQKGALFLSTIAPFVERVCNETDLPLPPVFSSLLLDSERQIMESKDELEKATAKLKTLEESLYRDPVTQLYNQEFCIAYLRDKLDEVIQYQVPLTAMVLSIDNLEFINLDYGSAEGDKTMRTLADLLLQIVKDHVEICRLAGGTFAILCTNLTPEQSLERANTIRTAIAEEERFIVPITISIGLYHSSELETIGTRSMEELSNLVRQTAMFRLRLAKKQGGGQIVSSSTSATGSRSAFTILLVDEPGFDRDLIKQALEKDRYRVLTADDGFQAKKMVLDVPPDLIISELLIPKLSGLTLRKELMSKASLGKIPFLLMSINKNEQTIKRSFELQIRYFFKRPVALYEIVGLVNLIMERGD